MTMISLNIRAAPKLPVIRIVSSAHLRPDFSPPFRTTLEAHAYQHRRSVRSGYGINYDFQFKSGDLAASDLWLPPGHDPFHRNPESFARACDVAASQMSFTGAISSVLLLGDVAEQDCTSRAMLRIHEFVRSEILPLGLGVDATLHDPARKGSASALHAHLIVSCRSINRIGFGSFIRASKESATWDRWKAVWAATVAS